MSERRSTRIIVTLGPASSDLETIRELIKAGADVFRLNFSHGSHEFHGELIEKIKEAREGFRKPVAILQDLQGPKIRVGELKGGGPIELVEGREIDITEDDIVGDEKMFSVSLPGLARDVKPGDPVLLADGTMVLEVVESFEKRIRCVVKHGGKLLPRKGVNLPKTRISLPSLTEKDLGDLEFGLSRGVDYVALSFVRKGEEILDLKERIKKAGFNAQVVAKIERPEAVEASEEILEVSDAVMVARGDLGVELGAERVPLIQKQLIMRAREKAKPVITATEMLESMRESYRPTRAEASDVANAIEDGTSALMLSGETASGKHPVRVVEVMDGIASFAEKTLVLPKVEPSIIPGKGEEIAEAVVNAACKAAKEVRAKALVVFTRSGATARKVARYRLGVPVFAFTPEEYVYKQMALYWGVEPRISPRDVDHPRDLLLFADKVLLEEKVVEEGDLIVMVAGHLDIKGTTNTLRIWKVGFDETIG